MKKITIVCDVCNKTIHQGDYANTIKKIADIDLRDLSKTCETYIYNSEDHSNCDMCSDCLNKFMPNRKPGGGEVARSRNDFENS